MGMVERVARAICAATDITPENAPGGPYFDDPDSPYFFGKPQQQSPRWRLYIPAARAAIAAMREPAESQQGVGWRHEHCNTDAIWRAMIDAALAEPQS